MRKICDRIDFPFWERLKSADALESRKHRLILIVTNLWFSSLNTVDMWDEHFKSFFNISLFNLVFDEAGVQGRMGKGVVFQPLIYF